MNTRYDPRADKITVAITEAIIASQRDDEHPFLSYVETDTTLKARAATTASAAQVAGFISEWWPASNRNGGRH
jgi:hypothetical protein